MSSGFQKFQQIINGMGYFLRIFIGKSTHSVWVSVFITFTFLVIFNSDVKEFSPPEGQLFMYQGESYLPCSVKVGTGVISHIQEHEAKRFYQSVELFSSISANGKPVNGKIS